MEAVGCVRIMKWFEECQGPEKPRIYAYYDYDMINGYALRTTT